MTKSDLILALSAKLPHLSANDADVVVNHIFDAMTEALQNDRRIEIRGFGAFSVRKRRARQGRNPKTGAPISVPNKRVPFFKPGAEIRQRVNDGRADQ